MKILKEWKSLFERGIFEAWRQFVGTNVSSGNEKSFSYFQHPAYLKFAFFYSQIKKANYWYFASL